MKIEWGGEESLAKIVTKRGRQRLKKAARVISAAAKRRCPVGTISRPMYRSGPYAGQPWTSTDAGRLRKSIRIVERDDEKWGTMMVSIKSMGYYGEIRVYAGHYMAYYADIVEFRTPYMRPALAETEHMVKLILEDG
jgi:hypothetical protein